MQITPWQWITWKSCMSHSVTSFPKLGGHICVPIQLWWCCNCVTCVLQLVCCNCVTCVLQLVCVAIQVWSCCNCVTPCVAIELLQMQLRCNCVVIVCSSRCNWELIATGRADRSEPRRWWKGLKGAPLTHGARPTRRRHTDAWDKYLKIFP